MRIFIGSSNEQYPVVKEIRRDLMSKLSPNPIEIITWKEWFQRGENYGQNTWAVITKAIDYFDCAIMLLAGDDKIDIRREEYKSTRDNVLIESGAFAKAIGIESVFLLIDKGDQYHIPSDYDGLNVIRFDYERGADNIDAYRTMCERILQIREIEDIVLTSSFEKYKEEISYVQKEKRGKIK